MLEQQKPLWWNKRVRKIMVEDEVIELGSGQMGDW